MPAPKGNQNAKGNKGGGRESLYKPEYAKLAEKIAAFGATDKQLAEVFEVSEQTINVWKTKYVEFGLALKKGKVAPDDEMERSLFERGKGYEHPEDKIFVHNGEPVIVPTIKHYPPDTAAAFIWLKNRRPEKWRDRHEITGPDGGPIQIEVSDKGFGKL